MSHIVTVETKLTDKDCVRAAVASLPGFSLLSGEMHTVFNTNVQGLGIQLPNWTYPAVVQDDGVVKYDNYGGRWGSQDRMTELLQGYGLAVAHKTAARIGRRVTGVNKTEDGLMHVCIE